MSKISKISLLFSGISFVCLIVARLVLEGWHNAMWVPLGLFLGLLIVPFVKDGRMFVEFFTMKTTKRGMSMGMVILLVLTALSIVNVLSVRRYKTWDFSVSQQNTLSDQSKVLLKNLDSELKVTFFYKNGQEGTEEGRRAFRELIKKYQDQTDKLRLDFIEVNERPDLASQYGVDKGSGVVFLEYKGRRNRIEKIEEQEITSALVKVTREKMKTLYFVVGHGELSLDEAQDAGGANALKMLLTNNNYKVEILPLITAPKIPSDADLVAIVGPQHNFQPYEIEALENYLKGGGSLLLALESQKTVGLEKILAKIGIIPQNNYVLTVVETAMGRGVQQGPTVAPTFSVASPITRVFGNNEVALFQFPMSFTKKDTPSGVEVDEIVKSAAKAMAFKSLEITGEGEMAQYTFGVSAKGPWPGSAADAKPFMLAVYGDAAFLANSLLFQNLNRDLALNTVAALAQEENLISIAPREAGITEMKLTSGGFMIFLWLFAIPLPLLLLTASIGLWARRRFA